MRSQIDPSDVPRLLLVVFGIATLLAIPVTLAILYPISRIYHRRMVRRTARVVGLLQDGDEPAARTALTEWASRTRSWDLQQHLTIARLWSRLGDPERALAILSRAKVPSWKLDRRSQRLFAEARYDALVAAERWAEASWLLNDTVDRDPRAPWLTAARIKAARRTANPTELSDAIASATAAFERQPNEHLRAAAEVLEVALERHRFAEAVPLMEDLVARIESMRRRGRVSDLRQYHQLFVALGAIRLAAGDEAGAEESFATAVERARDHEAVRREVDRARAKAHHSAFRFEEATRIYERVVAERDDPEMRLGLAECRRRLGGLEAAARDVERALELGCEPRKATLVEARILSDLGRGSEAARSLDGIVDERSDDPESLYTLTYVRVLHLLPGAEEALRRYAALVPDDPDLAPLLARPSPDGRAWDDVLKVAPRPDR